MTHMGRCHSNWNATAGRTPAHTPGPEGGAQSRPQSSSQNRAPDTHTLLPRLPCCAPPCPREPQGADSGPALPTARLPAPQPALSHEAHLRGKQTVPRLVTRGRGLHLSWGATALSAWAHDPPDSPAFGGTVQGNPSGGAACPNPQQLPPPSLTARPTWEPNSRPGRQLARQGSPVHPGARPRGSKRERPQRTDGLPPDGHPHPSATLELSVVLSATALSCPAGCTLSASGVPCYPAWSQPCQGWWREQGSAGVPTKCLLC